MVSVSTVIDFGGKKEQRETRDEWKPKQTEHDYDNLHEDLL